LAGETGVQTVMEYLLAELDLTMALNGCPTIRDISSGLLGVKQNL
jgi:isopentenyl diphosphate isomerase/L-lactate dehydrogenase-like FMN-dependent dehydrogenase